MGGPPLVPIFPIGLFIGLFFRGDSRTLHFDIEVKPMADSVRIEFPTLAIKVDSNEELLYPIDSFLVQRQFNRIADEGLYHWDFTVGSLNYMYRFKTDGYPSRSFEVLFLKPYLGCTIPPIKYVVQSGVRYEAFVIPVE